MAYYGKPSTPGTTFYYANGLLVTGTLDAGIGDSLKTFPAYGDIKSTVLYSDFLCTNGIAPFGSVSLGGGVITNYVAVDQKRIGFVKLACDTTSSAFSGITTDLFNLEGKEIFFRSDFSQDLSIGGINEFTAMAGFLNPSITTKTAPTDGVFFRYTYLYNSSKWQCVTMSSSLTSVINSTVGNSLTYKAYEIKITPNAKTASFYIDGTLIGSLSSTMPSGLKTVRGMTYCNRETDDGSTGGIYLDLMAIKLVRTGSI